MFSSALTNRTAKSRTAKSLALRILMIFCFAFPAMSCELPESPDIVAGQLTTDGLTTTPGAEQGQALERRFQGAQRVVVASVAQVSAAFGHNAYGDRLILSTVTLQVHEHLRGAKGERVSFEMEGGTVGSMTLTVSDLPALRPGDRGVFALRRASTGQLVPNRRGLGILLLTPGVDLQPVRRAEEVTR